MSSHPCDTLLMPQNFIMAAEWAAHRKTWLCWPARESVWGGAAGLKRAKRAYADVIRAIAAFEPVGLAVCPGAEAEARAALTDLGNRVDYFAVPIDDSWMRDTGPTFLRGAQGLQAVQWRFNAWGGKYTPYDKDAALATHMAARIGIPCTAAPLFCEGGGIHSDGEGTLLATTQTLCNPNRNAGMGRDAVEAAVLAATGAQKMIWLGEGFSDDETDGHIDNIAAFAAPGKILIGVPAYEESSDWGPVQEALAILRTARDAAGRPLEVIAVEQPLRVREDWRGRPLNASYLNFVFVNGGILLPTFDDENDEKAAALFRKVFPDRRIVAVDGRAILQGGGGLHCITLAEPQA